MKTAGTTGENTLIERLARLLPSRRDVVTGIGDDCAVVRASPRDRFDLILTSDPVVEGVHFRSDAAPEAVGHKAVGRVLSDIAAMGGEPLWALIDLVAPAGTPVDWLARVYRGASRLARRHGLAIVGGDTSSGPVRELHVFAAGRLPRGTAVLRSGAQPGDILYVTGRLGGSIAGRHLRFEPRLAEGQWLRAGRWASAMMDVSDGIATDLPRLLKASRAGAVIEAARIPVSAAARRLTATPSSQPAPSGLDSVRLHALSDGEDFELLFTVPAARGPTLEHAWARRFRLPLTRIGVITNRAGVLDIVAEDGRRSRLTAKGFEHFSS